MNPVRIWTEDTVIPTYLPAAPDKNPMFLEKRVYQGSSGKVYPLPFTDRIADQKTDRGWKTVWLENEFVRVMVLPEIGGRIHAFQDKTNGYDLIYRQPVIKPALVGLAGPWISGGIEFNWPQHHRPATFLPVDFEIEEHADGSKTVWCSDHDPMARMKAMHGICLHPGRSCVELKVRAYNRTPLTQSFLWWANVATRVHEGYQSFFPPDVCCVADHARRSMSDYPLASGFYYGVNYGGRGRKGIPPCEIPKQFVPLQCAPNDLSFYANIPVPTSYMGMGSQEDFFGGYDHKAQAGIIHIANHHISPGKKQWTWGNHEFGYAWDRNLTDPDSRGEYGPYIEIMAGVYTDNQPDFSFLQPGETKTWSQYWYPIQKIGPAQHANLEAAVSLKIENGGIYIGVSVTRPFSNATISLTEKNRAIAVFTRELAPGAPLLELIKLSKPPREMDLRLCVLDRDGNEIISYQPKPRQKRKVPPPATEPPAPAKVASVDELYLTGVHLEQYRHATRCATLYWREALRRDPLDARSNNAMGLWHLKRGEFAVAEKHFRQAIARLTQRNPNPRDGEAYYNLGLCLRHQAEFQVKSEIRNLKLDAAYAAFYKSVWNQAWMAAGYHALAEIDALRKHWDLALDHLDRSLRFNTDNLRARNLKVMVLRVLGRETEADRLLQETLVLDPLDWWARLLNGKKLDCDLQIRLDITHDLARAGFEAMAIAVLDTTSNDCPDLPTPSLGALPLIEYTLGWLWERLGDKKSTLKHYKQAGALSPDYCFPARLEEIIVLQAAMRTDPQDARAPYYLGNLLYDRRRHDEALRLWEKSARLDGSFSVVWRNLGIGYFNIRRDARRARRAYDRAFQANRTDARLLYERDQLWKRLGETPARRLRELEKHSALVSQRDDLSVELCALLNQTGQPARALQLLAGRRFQPWEGGEGGPLGQHVRARIALGREALARHDYPDAVSHFENALAAPPNLGEAKHLLANQSDIFYWLGCAHEALRQGGKARQYWLAAAKFKGDFQEMSVRPFSEMTCYSALAWKKLGRPAKAERLLRDLLAHARKLEKSQAKINYFATSLPTMLLFDDDLQFRQKTTALFLQAQAWLGLGYRARGRALLKKVMQRDPNHALAADLQKGHTRIQPITP